MAKELPKSVFFFDPDRREWPMDLKTPSRFISLADRLAKLEARVLELETKLRAAEAPIARYLSVTQVCEKYRVDKSTVHRNIKTGRIKGCGGRPARVLEADVAKFWDRR